MNTSVNSPSLTKIQTAFLAAMPRIVRHANCYCRNIRCRHRKADFVSDVVGICWKWWVRLFERGKDPTAFVSTLATFATRAVRSGRRLSGAERMKDVFSSGHGFSVVKLPDYTNPMNEALCETPNHDPARIAAFLVDFPAWLSTHTVRNRTIAVEMAMGETTQALAHRFKISPGRCSQLRRYFHDSWELFTEDDATGTASRVRSGLLF